MGVGRTLASIILTIIAVCFAPFAVLLLPVYAFRQFVACLAPLMRKDLGKMLSPRSNLFAVEYSEMFTKKTRCPIYVSHVVDNILHVEALRQFFTEAAVLRKLPNGELQSPELQQTITSWFGYLFWQWDKDFKIENHIKFYTGPGKTDYVSDEDIPEIMKELSSRPFPPGQSPWEIWMWDNARLARDPQQKPKTICIFKIHHSLADGYSILRLLVEDISKQQLRLPIDLDGGSSASPLQKFWKFLTLAVKAPFELIDISISSWDFNPWHIPEEKLTARLNTALTTAIPIEDVKEIKKMYGVSFNVVLQAAFTGGVRNFMLEKNMQVPNLIHCMVPLPMPGHPGKLRNHMTAILNPLPIGIKDPRERIRAIQKTFKKLQKSSVPYATFCMLPIIGALPAWVVKILAKNVIATCLMTNFPAPATPVNCLGQEIDDIVFGGGLLVGNIGIGLSSLSYNGNIRLGAGIDEAIFSDPEEARTLVRKIEEELDVMRGLEVI